MSNVISAQYFDDRVYKITEDGQEYFIPSVTTILGIEDKPFLLKWYADLGWDEARKRLHESSERGKRIHFGLWVYLQGGKVIYNPWQNPFYLESEIEKIKKETNNLFMVIKNQDEMVALWKLQKFFEIVKPEIVMAEETVYSLEDRIAGTVDIVLKINAGKYDVNGRDGLLVLRDGLYVVDLKSGNQVSESAWAQTATYCRGVEKSKKLKTMGSIILHTSSQNKKGIEGFAALLKTSEELKPHYEIFKSLQFVWNQRNPNLNIKAFEFPILIERSKS